MVAFFVSFMVYCLLSEILAIAHTNEDVLNDLTLIDKAAGMFGVFSGLG